VRLTVDGKAYTQPLTLRLDPRVRTPAAGLAQLARLSRELYDRAVAAHAASVQARALATQLESVSTPEAATFKAALDSIAPAPSRGPRPGGFGRRRGAAAGVTTLDAASTALINAAMAMQGADATPTVAQLATANRARADAARVMSRWTALQARAPRR
jgi:hypothetical protein